MAEQPLIVLIDDEEQFLDIFGDKLSAAGFRVVKAASGAEGIEKAQTLAPNLILLDVKMPGMSGAEVMMKLRGDPKTKDMPVVFLTSLGDPRAELPNFHNSAEKFSREAGAKGYIRKTDDLDSVMDQVKSFL